MRILVVFALLSLRALPALAWNDTGHSVIAEIAERHLTSAARTKIESLLGAGSLAGWAGWADNYAATPPGAATLPWHVVSIDYANQIYADSDCKVGETIACLVSALRQQIHILLPPASAPPATAPPATPAPAAAPAPAFGDSSKRLALLFVINLIGDIHQPLRCVKRAGYGPGELSVLYDDGATKTATTLRDFWDGMIDAGDWGAYVDQIDTTVVPTLDVQVAADPADSVVAWANECHAAGQKALALLPPPTPPAPPPAVPAPPSMTLHDKDRVAARPLLDKELALAGLRLAAVLNQLK